MILDIDFHNGVPIYRQLVRQIQQLIISGAIAEGQQIESVRELALQLKVNPMTISKAYSILESDGLLERRRGIGLFAAKLTDRQKTHNSRAILDELLGKAASAAVQMGITQPQALEAFKQQFEKHQSKAEKQNVK